MPKNRRYKAECGNCGRKRAQGESFSATGLCGACGERLMRENATAIAEHRGPEFERWRRAMAASVGAVLPERDTNAETL